MQACGYQTNSYASIGGLDPRRSRQMDMPACPLGSVLAGIKHKNNVSRETLYRLIKRKVI